MAAAPSVKRLQIDKAYRTMVIIVGTAAFVAVFSLISCKALLSQMSYQNRVMSARRTAVKQLKADVSAEKTLVSSYQAFDNSSSSLNLIGGSVSGTANNDGDNAKIILDALPSQFDYPALATSLQNLLSNEGVTVNSVQATNIEPSTASGSTTTTTTTTTSSTASPTVSGTSAVAIPVTFSVSGSEQAIQNVINTFQASIRPFQIQTMQLSGDQSNLTLSVTAQTFYQPAKTFNITSETVE